MGKMRVARAEVETLTLADLKVSVDHHVGSSPFPSREGESECADLEELALLLRRPGGFVEFWWAIVGFAEILGELVDHDAPTPSLLVQLRGLTAGLRAVLEEVSPLAATSDDVRACRLEIRQRDEAPEAVA
jgi:hypothetical protein